MAESSGEKTEMPTPKKLRDARQKGQVCTSKDIVFRLAYDNRFDWSYWNTGYYTRSDDGGKKVMASGKFAKEPQNDNE